MTEALLILVIILPVGAALRSGHRHGLIVRRPYNNRYNDATGARDRHY